MSLNTAEKRRAASGIVVPLLPGVTPKSAKDVEWRREAAWSYPFALGAAEWEIIPAWKKHRRLARRSP